MKKHKAGAIKLFFLFATLGAFPFLYPATQMPQQNMGMVYDRSFEVLLTDKSAPTPADLGLSLEKLDAKTLSSQVLVPIDPALGLEVQPDSIE